MVHDGAPSRHCALCPPPKCPRRLTSPLRVRQEQSFFLFFPDLSLSVWKEKKGTTGHKTTRGVNMVYGWLKCHIAERRPMQHKETLQWRQSVERRRGSHQNDRTVPNRHVPASSDVHIPPRHELLLLFLLRNARDRKRSIQRSGTNRQEHGKTKETTEKN